MDLFLAICQGLGLALAIGAGGVLVPLFAAVMVSLDAGIDLGGTDWEFLGSTWFVTVLFAFNVVAYLGRRGQWARLPLLAALVVAGALFAAGSLAERGEPAVVGIILGAAVALGAAMLATGVLAGAQRRARASADSEGDAGMLTVLFAGVGIVAATIAIVAPPVSLLLAAGLVLIAGRRRRRAGEKYEGLRILR